MECDDISRSKFLQESEPCTLQATNRGSLGNASAARQESQSTAPVEPTLLDSHKDHRKLPLVMRRRRTVYRCSMVPTTNTEDVSVEELEGKRLVSRSARKKRLNSVLGETSKDFCELLHYLRKSRCERSGRESAPWFHSTTSTNQAALAPEARYNILHRKRAIKLQLKRLASRVMLTPPRIRRPSCEVGEYM